MAWLKERQTLLAENVANADTPGYVPQDLKPLDFRQLVSGKTKPLGLVTDAPNQISGSKSAGQFTTVADPAPERTLSGNAVDLETEMMKVYQNTADHQLVSEVYRQQMSMLKSVLGRSSG
jgi:flagellar basal-body rod protein FlgB